jgi:hypothetical protein
MLEPVVATLEPRQKMEMLKRRAKHINSPDWKRANYRLFCDKAESVYRQRNESESSPVRRIDTRAPPWVHSTVDGREVHSAVRAH